MKTLNELFREVIALNEGGDDIACRLSHASGGTSGYSFGLCQFDVRNNDQAIQCLVDCGFTNAEITALKEETVSNLKPLNDRLKAHADIIAQYDTQQLAHCLNAAANFVADHGIPVSDTAAMLALADTINQYGSLGDGSAAYLSKLGRPITAGDVLAMKLKWKYSQTAEGRNDTIRWAENVQKVIEANS